MNSEGNPNKKITETIVGFWNKHRKGILTVTSIIGAIGTVVLGAKCYWTLLHLKDGLRTHL